MANELEKAGPVSNFLSLRGWKIEESNNNFIKYISPFLAIDQTVFKVTIPSNIRTDKDRVFLNRAIQTIAQLYNLTLEEMVYSIVSREPVFATRIIDRDTEKGSIPLLKFEHCLSSLRKILVYNAGFAVTKEPLPMKEIPLEAEHYINNCDFLQTERGSFIAKVQLPDNSKELNRNLFDEYVLTSKIVNEKLVDVFQFCLNSLFNGSESIMNKEYVVNNIVLTNISLFREISSLLKRTEVNEMEFSFTGDTFADKISSGQITEEKTKRFDNYIDFAEELFSKDIEVETTGKIYQLRSLDTKGNSNLVVIKRIQKNTKPIHVLLNSIQYKEAINAHERGANVYISGTAAITSNYLRMIRIKEFYVK
ncbi:hypothetical protein [Hymenobacter sp. GOD-10R]|uniref:hypothetical protein n=1 Tax=Hymenobacter sp. GOD-10R TaxID=3093922 RepID=UPI002D787A16|nr:hypothetical protein [Hymenobacter sp. GOD-10R]WRQ28776.1 hypothetical protein SD425_00670 [Hymenobacter sp. GOD-10R]